MSANEGGGNEGSSGNECRDNGQGNELAMQKVLKVSLPINSNTITLQMAFSVRTVDDRLMWRDVKEMR